MAGDDDAMKVEKGSFASDIEENGRRMSWRRRKERGTE
jgi:hypothetical protein